MESRFERYHPDMEAMHHGFRTQSCFVYRLVVCDAVFRSLVADSLAPSSSAA